MSINRDEAGMSSQAQALVSALRDLHLRAGKPTMRSMSKAIGTVSHTTVAEALAGKRIPSWSLLASIVAYLGGDEEEFRRLWIAATEEASGAVAGTQAFRDFLALYRQQVTRYHGRVSPPSFDRRHSAPLEALYVQQRLVRQPRDEHAGQPRQIDVWQLDDEIKHTVVLANPGGGKSTLCQALMYRHSVDQDRRIPFLIRLRDFAHEVPPARSIVGYIEHELERLYQCQPPQDLISSLLLNGAALVMFDGLDELLDTTRRAEIAAIIELFCAEFPMTPVLVTSRLVGYHQAQLDPKLFDTYQIADFDDTQVEQYAKQWFRLDDALTRGEADQLANSFMDESTLATDLRANPLMLALMCTLYRGRGYLPGNRPELYEMLASLMFERWDASRGIQVWPELPFSWLLRSLLRYLAFQMLTQRDSQPWSTSELLRAITEYLLNRVVEDRDEAEEAARRVLEFCRGRAWVLTDVGTTARGEKLYGFTHHTFMEYFAAEHLVRTSGNPETLAMELAPHVAQQQWGMVDQIAVQIADRTVEDGAKRVIMGLFEKSNHLPPDERSKVRNFLVQCLEFTHLPPSLKHRLTASVESL